MTVVIFAPSGDFDELALLAVDLLPQLRDHRLLLPQDLIDHGFLRDGFDHLLMLEETEREECFTTGQTGPI